MFLYENNILRCFNKREITFLHKVYCLLQMFSFFMFSVIADIILLKKKTCSKRDITQNMNGL